MESSCPPALDNSFGPSVNPCRRTLDFTLLFEQLILSILLSAIALMLIGARLWQLRSAAQKVNGLILLIAKLILWVGQLATQFALSILWAQNSNKTRASVSASVLSLISAIAFIALSFREHRTTIRPSPLICVYLIAAIIFHAPQVRTLWLSYAVASDSIPPAFTASHALYIVLLGAECLFKTKCLMREEDRARSPEDKCGIISKSFFAWMNPVIATGYRRLVTIDELYPPPIDASPELVEEKLWQEWEKKKNIKKHRLLFAMALTLKFRLLGAIVPRLCLIGFVICQPLLLQRLVEFLHNPSESQDIGYGLIGAYAIVFVGIAVSNAWYWHQNFKLVTGVRAGLVSMVYNKTTKLSISAVNKNNSVTLMSADVERIVNGLRTIHDIWANFIQIAIAAWLLEKQVGVATVAPLVVAAVCGYITLKVGDAAGTSQGIWMESIEKRIDVTSNTLSAIRGVKLSGLTEKVTTIIQSLRIAELASAGSYRLWECAALMTGFFPVFLSPVLTFAIFIGANRGSQTSLDTARMFVSLSFLTLISQPLSILFQSAPEIMSMVTCFDRVDAFIQAEQWKETRSLDDSGRISTSLASFGVTTSNEKTPSSNIAQFTPGSECILIREGEFGWDKETKPTLQNINLAVPGGKLTMVIGPVGCGKSTLLKCILGETATARGSVILSNSSIAFCDQTPWIINGTFRDNIVMLGNISDPYYDTVVRVCALTDDLAQLENGDQSNLGSKGITLSGGQKQRLSLARALFARRDVLVCDDVLSGLDATTESKVFASVFGPNGLLVKNGTTVVLATHAIHLIPYANHIVSIGTEGTISQQGSFYDLQSCEGYVRELGVVERKNLVEDVPNTKVEASYVIEPPKSQNMEERTADIGRLAKPQGVYRFYAKSLGVMLSVVYLLAALGYTFLYTFPYVWAKWWSDENSRQPHHREAYYMGIYAMLQVMCLLILLVLARHAVITIVTIAGRSLHLSVLNTAFGAPLSFFEKTETGSIVNRFSQDMALIDDELPGAMFNIACSGFIAVGQLLLIMNSSYYLAISFPIIFLVLWALQRIYLRTSRQLRTLELEAKSPLYSQFLESLDGLATIRAFSWQANFKALNHERLDRSQRPFYLLLCLRRWLAVVLDCLVAGFVLLIVGLAVGLRGSASAGFVGVALSNMMNLSGTLSNLVLVWTQLETSMASVERIKRFREDTPSENKGTQNDRLPPSWPASGDIKITNLDATYREGATKALRNLSMSIRHGEKIGVCGRTGSGKTSLMLALFKMIDVSAGSITIDGVDIADLPPSRVRSSLNAIPQEPYFFSGTIRENADPINKKSDNEILQAFKSVCLDQAIEKNGGLDAEMQSDKFSHGERQLFCLARAVLKNSKIAVLDEMTSNIDVDTEKRIRSTIAETFKDCTVITIAHRLSTILESDRIAVLHDGELVEFDSPQALLNRESRFRDLYNQYKNA